METPPAGAPISQTNEQNTFVDLVQSIGEIELGNRHIKRVEDLKIMQRDPKRKNTFVATRCCSFNLVDFDLDEKSNRCLGPPYHMDIPLNELAFYSVNVVSLRVVKTDLDYRCPIEVYGRVIARDAVDYKCVYLFDRPREDAQVIKDEGDMLALTGPHRALVVPDIMWFEFDLRVKAKDKDKPDVQFSKGVISYYHDPYNKRVISQLPSFRSTVKLVLQQVGLPVAATVEIKVAKGWPVVHFAGKITAGTSRNYRQHMVLYDSSVSGCFSKCDGSLVLARNLVAVRGPVKRADLQEDEPLMLYVCFLDESAVIEDEDEIMTEEEDEDEEGEEDEDEDEEGEEDEDEDEDQDCDEDEEDGEDPHWLDPKRIVSFKYPDDEAFCEYGSSKLEVKVNWTAIHAAPSIPDMYERFYLLPDGFKAPDYRHGGFHE